MLLIVAFFTSYIMQQRKITAVHETVISIFAGAPSLPVVFAPNPSLTHNVSHRNDRRPDPPSHSR